MAIYKYRELEMNRADGCVKMPVKTIDGEVESIPHGSERDAILVHQAAGAMTAMHCRVMITMRAATRKTVHVATNSF